MSIFQHGPHCEHRLRDLNSRAALWSFHGGHSLSTDVAEDRHQPQHNVLQVRTKDYRQLEPETE